MSHNGSEDLPKRGVTPTPLEAAIAQSPGSTELSTDVATARVIAIGDVHGCVHALDALLEAIAPRSDDCIVQLGDFIDSGRDTRDVLDTLLALQSNCRLVTLMGNHEEMLLGALESDRLRDTWLMCGGVDTLNSYRFGAGIDVLPDPSLREGIKTFSEWPTIPQLYVKGEFVGGCDIVREMQDSGELKTLFETKGVEFAG